MYFRTLAIFCAIAIVHVSDARKDEESHKRSILESLAIDPTSVSEHDIVKVGVDGSISARILARKPMRIHVFGKNIDLWLQPKDSRLISKKTPVYMADRADGYPENILFSKHPALLKIVGKMLEDPRHRATLVINKDQHGRLTVNGCIGSHNLVVRSLSHAVAQKHLRRIRSIDGDSAGGNSVEESPNSTYHLIYRSAKHSNAQSEFSEINDQRILARINRSTARRIPPVIYIEILSVVDNSVYKAQGKDILSFLEYLVAFWNGVDLKFRGLENPRMRLHISAILIERDPGLLPYMIGGANIKSLQIADKFFYRIKDQFPLDSYDVAVTITRTSIKHIRGLANVGTVCSDSEKFQKMEANTWGQDDGAFYGVHVVAHELGHLLGSYHDDSSVNCKYDNGFLMAFTAWYTKNSTLFSECTIKHFQERLNTQKYECLYNAPRILGKEFPKLMPGKFMNLTNQCLNDGRGKPCTVPDMDICVNYYCMESDGVCRETGRAALEGTVCRWPRDTKNTPERHCIRNKCV